MTIRSARSPAEDASGLEDGGGPVSLMLAAAASMFTEDAHTSPGGCRGTAVLSADQTRRYLLTRRWDDGPLMAWVMLNPSTADARTDDATITRCVRRARDLGAFGGIAVVNLFSLRATDPRALTSCPDSVGVGNDSFIVRTCRTARPGSRGVGRPWRLPRPRR